MVTAWFSVLLVQIRHLVRLQLRANEKSGFKSLGSRGSFTFVAKRTIGSDPGASCNMPFRA